MLTPEEKIERRRQTQIRYSSKTKDAQREYQSKYYSDKNREIRSTPEYRASACERQRRRNATPEGKAKNRERKLKKQYGISREQWEEMFVAQGSCCAICKSPEPGSSKGWSTDHCHATEKVRGILCPLCNKALGLFKDNITSLQTAAKYLKSHIE